MMNMRTTVENLKNIQNNKQKKIEGEKNTSKNYVEERKNYYNFSSTLLTK